MKSWIVAIILIVTPLAGRADHALASVCADAIPQFEDAYIGFKPVVLGGITMPPIAHSLKELKTLSREQIRERGAAVGAQWLARSGRQAVPQTPIVQDLVAWSTEWSLDRVVAAQTMFKRVRAYPADWSNALGLTITCEAVMGLSDAEGHD